MADHKKNRYTVMFVPEGKGRTISLSVNKTIVHILTVLAALFFIGIGLLVYKSGEIAAKLQLVYTLRAENEQLQDENRKLLLVKDKFDNIRMLSEYLSRLARSTDMDVSLPALNTEKKQRGQQDDGPLPGSTEAFAREQQADGRYIGSEEPNATDQVETNRVVPNIRPVEGWITKRFISVPNDTSAIHTGVDFAASTGTIIIATAPATVENIENDKYFGLLVTLRHSEDFTTRYGHCQQVLVSKGQTVTRGQAIALVGNTGRSSAPHLHYEVIRKGKHVDPMAYMVNRQD